MIFWKLAKSLEDVSTESVEDPKKLQRHPLTTLESRRIKQEKDYGKRGNFI